MCKRTCSSLHAMLLKTQLPHPFVALFPRYRLGGYHGAGRLLLSDSKIATRSRDLFHPLPGIGGAQG